MTQTLDRAAVTSATISDVIANRWSPRSFDVGVEIPQERVTALLEAARWAASANNSQPWRFVVGQRGGRVHRIIQQHLMGFNQAWAGTAAVLMVNVAEVADEDGNQRRWAECDLGQAVATLSLQAHKDGYHAHQMGGFDAKGLHSAFGLDDRFEVVSVVAIGALAAPEHLPNDILRERETAPRSRKPLDELVLLQD